MYVRASIIIYTYMCLQIDVLLVSEENPFWEIEG